MTIVQVWFSLVAAGVLLAVGVFAWRRWRYRRAVYGPFPAHWQEILDQYLPVYSRLPTALQSQLQRLVMDFLYYKRFVGCAGLEVTEAMRLIIAAEACMLILNRPSQRYAGLRWIYIYPSTFVAQREQSDAYGVVSQTRSAMLGESWSNGRVILAWDSVARGIADFNDGRNVVLHEFAHQLDTEDGSADGAPLLYTRDSYAIWSQVFSEEFQKLHRELAMGFRTLIDSYGATNPAEFFAVVTELFFERPAAMRERHPELFEQLLNYYRVNPLEWSKHL